MLGEVKSLRIFAIPYERCRGKRESSLTRMGIDKKNRFDDLIYFW